MKVLITGGAGLVGSSLTKRLLARGDSVLSVDDFTLGTQRHISDFTSHTGFHFEKRDVSQADWYRGIAGAQGFDLLIHHAANSDISLGHARPEMDYQRTLLTTFEALQAARQLKIPNFIFSSSSAVYGVDPVMPTPEETTPMYPVSIYGAGKLASENFISAFVENYGLNAWVYRFGNVVGERLTHGVIYDFTKRLLADPKLLTVLGNGNQNKTYIDVEDCVSGILHAYDKSPAGVGRNSHRRRFQVFNLSTDGACSVREIAQECNRAIVGGSAAIEYGEAAIGWVGDVPKTSLEVSRMARLGWAPRLDSRQAVFKSIQDHYGWVKSEKL